MIYTTRNRFQRLAGIDGKLFERKFLNHSYYWKHPESFDEPIFKNCLMRSEILTETHVYKRKKWWLVEHTYIRHVHFQSTLLVSGVWVPFNCSQRPTSLTMTLKFNSNNSLVLFLRKYDKDWSGFTMLSVISLCTLSGFPSPCRDDLPDQRWGGPLQDEDHSGSHPHSFPGLY